MEYSLTCLLKDQIKWSAHSMKAKLSIIVKNITVSYRRINPIHHVCIL